jgi:beta-glucosidase
MDQQLVTTLTDPNSATCGDNGFNLPNDNCMQKILIDAKTGSVLAGGTNNPIDTTGQGGPGNTGFDWANEYNIIQRYAIKNSRLHIPLVFGVDAVHGFGHPWQAPLYPQSIGMGATWDPNLARAGGAATASALRATVGTGTSHRYRISPRRAWGHIAGLGRGRRSRQRWARPTWRLANASDRELDVAATVKHFASQAINGHDATGIAPLNYLQSVMLLSYAGGLDAGAQTV